MKSKRRTFRYDKLVRDKIVPEMLVDGDEVEFEILEDDQRYLRALLDKLVEEAGEAAKIVDAPDDELLGELGDLEAIIDDILVLRRLTRRQLNAAKVRKNNKRGRFRHRYFIHAVTVSVSSPWLQYYLDRPDQYPEVAG